MARSATGLLPISYLSDLIEWGRMHVWYGIRYEHEV